METRTTMRSSHSPDPCVIELHEMLQAVLGDDFIRLYHYGSRVEGGADSESDYDVLCITKRPLSREKREKVLDRQLDIQLKYGVVFDLHFRCEEQLDSTSLRYTPYVDHVMSVGIVV